MNSSLLYKYLLVLALICISSGILALEEFNAPKPFDRQLFNKYLEHTGKEQSNRRFERAFGELEEKTGGPKILSEHIDVELSDRIPTNQFAIKIKNGVHQSVLFDTLSGDFGLEFIGKIGYMEDWLLFEKQLDMHAKGEDLVIELERMKTFPFESGLEQLQDIICIEHQIASRIEKHYLPTDPLFAKQWHLNDEESGYDVNILNPWSENICGKDVVVSIVDDGVEYQHPDLFEAYIPELSYDMYAHDPDPYPSSYYDRHGTSVAGCALARHNNGVCGTSPAYCASLAAVRLIAGAITDAQIAAALTYKMANISIYSNSWGYRAGYIKRPPAVVADAVKLAQRKGRNGKGSLYTFSSGNDRKIDQLCSYDYLPNLRQTIVVGAINNKGKESYYSEMCPALTIVAPSGGHYPETEQIYTTDRLGSAGYNMYSPTGTETSNCTNVFSGTSAAAPIAAGVLAVLLSSRPDLTYRDVNWILALHSRRLDIDSKNCTWDANGAGIYHSDKYGFGMVDTEAYVNAAKDWVPVPPDANPINSGKMVIDQTIPILGCTTAKYDVNIDYILEHVEIDFKANVTMKGSISVELISPSGVVSLFVKPALRLELSTPDWDQMFTSVKYWGESSKGKWTLRVCDKFLGSEGAIVSWAISLYGSHAEDWYNITWPSPSPMPTCIPTPHPAAKQCSEKLITDSEGEISDGSTTNERYEPNLECHWLIDPTFNGSVGAKWISVDFKYISLSPGYYSPYWDQYQYRDVVFAFDGKSLQAPVIGWYDGIQQNVSIWSQGPSILFWFHTTATDYQKNYTGWEASYKVHYSGSPPSPTPSFTPHPTVEPKTCSFRYLTVPSDTFDDGSGSKPYSNSLYCLWIINPYPKYNESEYQLQLRFLSFKTANSADRVILQNNYGDYIGIYYGHRPPFTVQTDSMYLRIFFITDSHIQDEGWTVKYNVVPRGGLAFNVSSFNDNFDDSFHPKGDYWDFHSTSISTMCGSFSSSHAMIFNGAALRYLETKNLMKILGLQKDCRITVQFMVRHGNESSGCERPDNGENLHLEYSTDPLKLCWKPIAVLSSSFPSLENWSHRKYVLPPDACSDYLVVRWSMPVHSGAQYDVWAIDDVDIDGDQLPHPIASSTPIPPPDATTSGGESGTEPQINNNAVAAIGGSAGGGIIVIGALLWFLFLRKAGLAKRKGAAKDGKWIEMKEEEENIKLDITEVTDEVEEAEERKDEPEGKEEN